MPDDHSMDNHHNSRRGYWIVLAWNVLLILLFVLISAIYNHPVP